MSETRIVVDPLTRIEGHMRMQAVLGADGKIADAWSTGTMWRGIEVILKGRDPRDAWAFTERICGVCTGIHALAAVRAVEGAIGIKIPANANIIRNLMNAVLFVQDHVTHFYQLHALDWVDVISALKGIRAYFLTLGGVTVTPRFEAKNLQGDVIPNLYVIGQDIGGLYDSTYDLRCEGSASSFAMTSGRLAAIHAIDAIKGKTSSM